MTTKVDKAYRIEKLLDWEYKSLKERFSLTDKISWQDFVTPIIIIFAISLVAPFLPSLHARPNWKPPTTIDEYVHIVATIWIVYPISFVALSAFRIIRNFIDLHRGVKRTANLRVTEVINLGIVKILVLNGWRPFTINVRQEYFKTAQKGSIITLKRTATFKLINYYIRDERAFLNE